MSLPTLLQPNSIIEQPWMDYQEKNQINNKNNPMISIDWMMKYIEKRIWIDKAAPMINIENAGNKVGIFRAQTGTGKSTVIPTYLYKKFNIEYRFKKNILCTEPTVPSATEIPYEIVAYYPEFRMGENIGYQTQRFINMPEKGIIFCTIGVLLQQLKSMTDQEIINRYSFIIIDEVHMRSIEIDTTLFYLKNFLNRNFSNPQCPYIILTSGTFDPVEYLSYFGCNYNSFLDIIGSSFYISDNFSKYTINNYINYITFLCNEIHIKNHNDIVQNHKYRDILIFVQGAKQIKAIVNKIHWLNSFIYDKGLDFAKKYIENNPINTFDTTGKYDIKIKGGDKHTNNLYLCPITVNRDVINKGETDYKNLYSNTSDISINLYELDKNNITSKVKKEIKVSRKVIISTNALETGITINSLKYCIDNGMQNELVYIPYYQCNIMLNKNVSQASSRQRRGRVGRKTEGIFYTAYTQDTYNNFEINNYPEIMRSDISIFLLDIISKNCVIENKTIKYLQKTDFNKLNTIAIPSTDNIIHGLEKLYILGYIDTEYKATLFGKLISKIRVDSLEMMRTILAGYYCGAYILDLITIYNFLMTKGNLLNKQEYKKFNVLNLSDSGNNYFHDKIIADEFIELLFIWYDLLYYMRENVEHRESFGNSYNMENFNISDIKLTNKLYEWSKKRSIDYDTIINIITARKTLIIEMISAGLNPYYNGLNLNEYDLVKIFRNNFDEGIEEIRKIKQCIYEGFKFNIFTWNDILKKYSSLNVFYDVNIGPQNILEPLILDNTIIRPKNIILGNVIIKLSTTKPNVYEFNGSIISVLDGYVNIDETFNFN